MFVAGRGEGMVEEIPREYLLTPHCAELYGMQDWGHDYLSSARHSALLDKIRLLLALMVLLKLQVRWNPLEGFLQHRFLGSTLQACSPLR